MSYDPEPELERYLSRLSMAARDLPRAKRRELVTEIEQHIREALAESPCDSRAEMLTLLDQVGDPSEIAAAGTDEPEKRMRSTAPEIAAIVLLMLGAFVFAVGWLVGVVLLWSSSAWTVRDKLIGTLVLPGGLAPALFFIARISIAGGLGGDTCIHHVNGTSTGNCPGGTSTLTVVGVTAGLVVGVIAPLATAVYLKRRLNGQGLRPHRYASAAIG